MKFTPVEPNIRQLENGSLQSYLVRGGKFHSECHNVEAYPDYDKRLRAARLWLKDMEVQIRTGVKIHTVDDTEPGLDDDVATYLRTRSKKSMPSYADRELHLKEASRYFGSRPRSIITGVQIKTYLRGFLDQGYSPASVNRRRTALMSLWTDLDGKSARNPVRDVPKYDEGEGEIRALSHTIIYRILSYMHRNVRRAPEAQGRGTRFRSAKTLIRLRVMAWTGWPQAQIKKVKPEHLEQLDKARAYVTARKKGRGVRADWLPLLPPAVTALRLFDQWDCYGPFDDSAMADAWDRALAQYNAHRARFGRRPIEASPYALRHSFGVLAAALFKDDSIVQRLMMHATAEQTQRYIRAARPYRLEDAVAIATSPTIRGTLERLRAVGETGRKKGKL